jgi:hypothetical protein
MCFEQLLQYRGRIFGRYLLQKSKEFSSLLFIVIFTNGFYLSKSGLKMVCNVNFVYGNLQFENSHDYAQKPQRNCTFMHFALVYAQQLLSNIMSFCNLYTSGAGSQIVPAIDGAGLQQYLTVLCKLSITGAGFSTCSSPCRRRPPTFSY